MFGTLFVTTLHDCQMSMQQCLDHAIANKLETQDALHSKVNHFFSPHTRASVQERTLVCIQGNAGEQNYFFIFSISSD
jgi:hypothetical protein